MATRVLDPDKVLELLRGYRPTLEPTSGPGGIYAVKFQCPYHNDHTPSFQLTPATGHGYCFSCKGGGSFADVIAKLENVSREEAVKIVAPCYKSITQKEIVRKAKSLDISLAQVNLWHQAIFSDTKLQVLMKRWGWTEEVISKYMLGSADGQLTIPMFEREDLVGLKNYIPGAQGNKYKNAAGSVPCVWPLENLEQDMAILVEGEKDCLTMLSAGFNAITFTTGAGAVPTDYIRYFAGKQVYVIYDIDEAGRTGAVKAARAISCAARSVHIVELPLEGIPKGDLTDAYMRAPEHFVDFINHLMENTDQYQPPEVVSRVTVLPEVHRTYLENIVKDKLFYKRVNLKARIVNNAQHETTIVPKVAFITCNKDYKEHVCQACPIHYKENGLTLLVRPEYPELMSMVGNNVKVQKAAMQSMAGVVEACTKVKIEQKEHQALYPIVIIPAIEADKKQHNYSMVTAWALDVPSQENEDYDVEGVVLANPETQKMELVCYRMDKDTTSLDSFELTEQMIERLGVFQCTDQVSNK